MEEETNKTKDSKTPLLESKAHTGKNENSSKWKNTLIGVILSFLSASLLLVNNTILKKMELDYTDAYFMRALFQICISCFAILKKGDNFWIFEVDLDKNIHKIRILFLLAVFFSGIFNLTDLIAVAYMPIGDAMTIILCGAIPTVILAAIFLEERLRLFKIICSVFVVTGIILVIRPPFLFDNEAEMMNSSNNSESINFTTAAPDKPGTHDHYYIGALGAFICMMSNAIFRTMIKVLHQNKSSRSSELMLLYHGLLCVVISFMMTLIESNQRILFASDDVEPYNVWQWLSLALFAIIGVTKFFMRLKALQLVGPVVVGFVRTSEILVSYLVEIVIFHVIPYLSSIFGAIFVMIACIGVLLEDKFLKCLPSNLEPIF